LTIKLTQHVPIRSGSEPQERGVRGSCGPPSEFFRVLCIAPMSGLQRRQETHRASSELAFPQIALLEQNLQLARRDRTP